MSCVPSVAGVENVISDGLDCGRLVCIDTDPAVRQLLKSVEVDREIQKTITLVLGFTRAINFFIYSMITSI